MALTKAHDRMIAGSPVNVLDYGADPTGAVDSSSAFQAAADAASALQSIVTESINPSGQLRHVYGPYLKIPAGKYKIETEITVSTGMPIIGENAYLVGGGSNKCFVFDGDVTGYVCSLDFTDFTTGVEFDTNNISQGRWVFEDVGFFNCTTGIDTVGYSDSRSTTLIIDGLRGGGTTTFVKSFCDVCEINAAFVWNKGAGAAFEISSRALITNSLLVPKEAVANARWFDFIDTGDNARGLTFTNVRFSGENAGITAVYNFVSGISASRNTIGISFNDCFIAANAGGPSNNGCAVVLTEDAGSSIAPNYISFSNCVVNGPSSNVAIKTESGSAVSVPSPVQFKINADYETIYSATAGLATTVNTFVESGLEAYYGENARKVFLNRTQELTATGNITINVLEGATVIFKQTGATTVTGLTNGFGGDIVTFSFSGSASNVTVQDRTVAGDIYLSGGSNFSTTANDTLQLVYNDDSLKWYEVSRSVN